MKVLVSAASRHGATTEVAAEIASVLAAQGIDTAVVVPGEVGSLAGYDAAVIGSAVYVGRWLEPARDLLDRHRDALRRIPVWLFSSGPVGDPPKPVDDPIDAAPMVALVGAREHRLFAGLVDKRRLGLGEKAIVAAVRASEGDFRPWPGIDAWAKSIAASLQEVGARR
jgi:menaquinone-dependent protoporphyrinogen oxidase